MATTPDAPGRRRVWWREILLGLAVPVAGQLVVYALLAWYAHTGKRGLGVLVLLLNGEGCLGLGCLCAIGAALLGARRWWLAGGVAAGYAATVLALFPLGL